MRIRTAVTAITAIALATMAAWPNAKADTECEQWTNWFLSSEIQDEAYSEPSDTYESRWYTLEKGVRGAPVVLPVTKEIVENLRNTSGTLYVHMVETCENLGWRWKLWPEQVTTRTTTWHVKDDNWYDAKSRNTIEDALRVLQQALEERLRDVQADQL